MKKNLLTGSAVFFISTSLLSLSSRAASIPSAASGLPNGAMGAASAACINPGNQIEELKKNYKTLAFQYNGLLTLLRTPLIKSAQDKTKSAFEQIKKAHPDIKDGHEKIEKLLYRDNGSERKIIDWVALGGKLEDVMMEVYPNLKSVLPLLERLNDRDSGLLAVSNKLGALRYSVAQLKDLPPALKDCQDWKVLLTEFPKAIRAGQDAQRLIDTILPLLSALDSKSRAVEELLQDSVRAGKKAYERAEKILGDNKDKTERRVAAIFIPFSIPIYAGEFIKDIGVNGKDPLRKFADVPNSEWKILKMNSNIISLAAATRKAVFPLLSDLRESLEDAKTSFSQAKPKIAPAIAELNAVSTSLNMVLGNVGGVSLPPANACLDCWFDD